jgi:hypothetical protein
LDWAESSYSRDTAIRFARSGALVRIECQDDACEVCQARSKQVYQPADVPRLPIRGCVNPTCRCQFVAIDPETQLAVPQMVEQGIAEIRAKRVESARQVLRRAVALDEMYELGWLWLSAVVDDREKVQCLQKVLAINPRNAHARAGLEVLQQKMARVPPALGTREKAPVPEPTAVRAPVLEQAAAPVPKPATRPAETPPQAVEIRQERKIIVEQWTDFIQFALEASPELLFMQGQAFLRKIEALNKQALALLPPETQREEFEIQWQESQTMSTALLEVLELHRSRRDGSPNWQAMHQAMRSLAEQLLRHTQFVRAHISTAGR